MTGYILVKCNCPNEKTAQLIAQQVVELKLAACVNILGEMKSVYYWQGKIEQDIEFQLQIKTHQSLFLALEQKIIELHPYDVAEIIALPIINGNQAYLDWIRENIKSS
ncbi:divalent-cation tolerance protein CutA [Psychrobium sp. 1_MG-2023]|uniref:divalent-cation tolerance protein CutA n=1 Tax=Psychrobium sp. 1_MG-2023 TaxID=3062624 RepID=UPI000C322778|nr:divalent-cation tolerance protein CutA [Psychrobium sp. 1_MG-2023]MDP2559572.1 divalent-cation tolerance protein CutA [Psychrobium sp. 1_MG-2023]PKF59411.1 divalent-cation tolerance protein CutA [Alteromonadales bacterium alter-6D02]